MIKPIVLTFLSLVSLPVQAATTYVCTEHNAVGWELPDNKVGKFNVDPTPKVLKYIPMEYTSEFVTPSSISITSGDESRIIQGTCRTTGYARNTDLEALYNACLVQQAEGITQYTLIGRTWTFMQDPSTKRPQIEYIETEAYGDVSYMTIGYCTLIN